MRKKLRLRKVREEVEDYVVAARKNKEAQEAKMEARHVSVTRKDSGETGRAEEEEKKDEIAEKREKDEKKR
jgi:hypothetical protein